MSIYTQTSETLEPFVPMHKTTVRDCVIAVSKNSDYTPQELYSNRRNNNLVNARYCVMFLARKLTSHSYSAIARAVGRKDHSTVFYGLAKADNLIAEGNLGFLTMLRGACNTLDVQRLA